MSQNSKSVSAKKKRVRKIILTSAFIALNVIVIAITATNEFGNSKNAAELSEVKINWWLLVPAAILFILATLFNVSKYVLMMRYSFKKSERPKYSTMWRIAWEVVMLGKYYDNITPAAVGGQPFQIYYMRKHSGLPHGHATALPIVAMVAGQIGFLVIAIVSFVLNSLMGGSVVLMVTAWIGLLFYAFWPLMMAGINFFPRPTISFLKFGVKVLSRLHIIKNRKAALRKIENELTEYVKSVNMISKTKYLLLKLIVISVIYNALFYMIPYFVLKAFGGDVDFLKCFVTTLAVTSAVYFVPTPGNAGAAEGTFYMVFSALSDGYVFWAMLVWRFFSYYIYILLGPLTYLGMRVRGRVNAKAQ